MSHMKYLDTLLLDLVEDYVWIAREWNGPHVACFPLRNHASASRPAPHADNCRTDTAFNRCRRQGIDRLQSAENGHQGQRVPLECKSPASAAVFTQDRLDLGIRSEFVLLRLFQAPLD